MANRDNAVSRAQQSQQPEDWSVENRLRNRCTHLLRTQKQRHLRNKLERCEEEKDIGGIWKNIKGYLGWGSAAGAPTELTDPMNVQLTNSPKKMANIQNQFYKDKVTQIREKLLLRGDPTVGLENMMTKRPHQGQKV